MPKFFFLLALSGNILKIDENTYATVWIGSIKFYYLVDSKGDLVVWPKRWWDPGQKKIIISGS